MKNPTDLFGHPAGPDQQSLFGDGEDRLKAPPQNFAPDPERVRGKLLTLLEQARNAQAMPWPEREARMWQTVFPNMANWLPEDEAEQLRFEFAQEIVRLSQAA
jgi:hypothetical protein